MSARTTMSMAMNACPSSSRRSLAAVVADTQPDAERFNLVLGITCHAIYHAGQVQLLKRLNAG